MTSTPPAPRPRGTDLGDSVEIAASADTVWALIADLPGWGRWNPVYPEASGGTAVGDTIRITVALPGGKPRPQTARVTASVPGRRLHFGASVLGGLLRATRYFEIAATGPDRCRVENGEVFAGPLAGLMLRKVGGSIREGLQLSSAGLKQAAEGRAAPPQL